MNRQRDGHVALGHDVDTVHLRIDGSFSRDVLKGLDHYAEITGEDGSWLRTTAKYENLRISATPSEIRIKGSLGVLLSGTNGAPFRRDVILSALRDAYRTFHRVVESRDGVIVPDLLSAVVTRLDFGVNVPLSEKVGGVEDVVSALNPAPPARLTPHRKHSAEIVLTTRRLAIYDKRRERGKRGVAPVYGDAPLARMELRLVKDVGRQMGRAHFTLRDLLDPELFDELGHRLIQAANEIPFTRLVRFPEVRTPSELRSSYATLGLEIAGGPSAAHAMIDSARLAGRLGEGKRGTERACALRKEVRRIWEHTNNTVEVEVGSAFRAAVLEAVFSEQVDTLQTQEHDRDQ